MKFSCCYCIFILLSSNLFAQLTDEKAQQILTATFKKYIPTNHTVIDSASSDYNSDGLMDIVIVSADKNNPSNNRSISILQKLKKGYQIAAQCMDAVLCADCGGIFGDPYSGISFKKNVLIIYHYGGSAWRWTANFTFRFQKNDWQLIGISNDSYWNLGECDGGAGIAGRNFAEVNFSTQKIHLIKTKDTNCTPETDVWKKIKAYKKVSLQKFNIQENYLKQIEPI